VIDQHDFTNPFPLDRVPDGWEIRSIESLCRRVTSGGTPSRSNPAFYETGSIRWYKTKELNDWYLEDSEEKITEEAVKNSSAKVFPAKTVLMAMYGDGDTITTLGILREASATNQACCAMIVNSDVCDHEYFLYALKYHRNAFIQIATGGAQRNLSGRLIRNFAIQVPPLPIQRRIAEILGRLDDKIEVNRRVNRMLEQMTQSLYQHWFVDFGPFQDDEFVESQLGPIPKGWTVKSLAELFGEKSQSVITGPFGSALHESDYREDGVPLILANHVNQGIIREDKMPRVGLHIAPKLQRYLLQEGDIVFTRVGIIDQSAYVPTHQSGWMMSGKLLRVRVPDKSEVLNSRYLAAVYQSKSFRALITSHAVGSTRLSLNTSILRSLPFVVPSLAWQERFSNIVRPQDEQIQINNLESKKLTEIRDYLLPKLLSGKIPVDAAEAFRNDIVANPLPPSEL
jgi:type I restriction enzyme, S subunit